MKYDFARPLRIATRQSPLALWQAEHVKHRLEVMYPNLTVELVKMTTKGDILLGSPLSKIGGKGLFLKELETAMQEGQADIAVHSAKDMPAHFPEGFILAAILEREQPEDAMVSNKYSNMAELPEDAIIGTCSLRRQCQLLERYPNFAIRDLRGNVGTRLSKLDAGEYDAIILARAGLMRLDLHQRIAEVLPIDISLPAVGQGAVAIECLEGSPALEIIEGLADEKTTWRVLAERAMNRRLEGGCQVPLAGYATLSTEDGANEAIETMTLTMKGLVGKPDGSLVLRAESSGNITDAEQIGTEVAEALLAQGAAKILSELA